MAQQFLLLALPIALIWFLRTTINHARSLEDVLRRLEVLEQQINDRAGEDLLTFQSRHPSRSRHVGGRMGVESVLAVFVTCLIMLLGCCWFARVVAPDALVPYSVYLVVVTSYLGHRLIQLRLYRYRQSVSLTS